MRLVTLAAILAICQADLLNRSYLPPAGAGHAGGSDGAIAAPAVHQRTQNEEIQRQNVNNNNQYQTPFIKPVFRNQISSNPNGQSNNVVRFGTNLQTGVHLNSYGETINDSPNNLLRSGGQREEYTRKLNEDEAQNPSNGQQSHQPTQEIVSLTKLASEQTKANRNSTFNEYEYGKSVYQTFIENNPNLHDERANQNKKPAESGASILRLDKQMASDAYSYSFETENGISAGENAVLKNGIATEGGYSYTGDDGQVYSVRYIADASGYRPIGNHLPTPPPVPEEILKSIEDNARAVAAGKIDDGFYHEQNYNTEYIHHDGSSNLPQNSAISFDSPRSYLPPVSGKITNDLSDASRKYLPPQVGSANNDHTRIKNKGSPLKLVQSTSGVISSSGSNVEESSHINTNLNNVINHNQTGLNNNSTLNHRTSNENNNVETTNILEGVEISLDLKPNNSAKLTDTTSSILEKKVEFEENVTTHDVNTTEFPSSNVVIPFPTLFTPKQQLTTPKEDQGIVPIEIHKPIEKNYKIAQNIENKGGQLNNSTQLIREPQMNVPTIQTTFNQTITVPMGGLELLKTTAATIPVYSTGYHYMHPQGFLSSSHPTEPNNVQSASSVFNGQTNFGTSSGILTNQDTIFVNAGQVRSGTVGGNQIHINEATVPNSYVQQKLAQSPQLTGLNSGYEATKLNQEIGRQAQLNQGTTTYSNLNAQSNVNNNRNTNVPQRESNQFIVSDQRQAIPSTDSTSQTNQQAEFGIRPNTNHYSQNFQNSIAVQANTKDTSLQDNYLNQFSANVFKQASPLTTNSASEANQYSNPFNSGNLVHATIQPTFQGSNQAVIANNLIRNSDISTHNNNQRVHDQDNYIHRSNLINNIGVNQKYHNDGKISSNYPHAIPLQNSFIRPSSLSNFQTHSVINNNVQNQYQTPQANTFITHSGQGISQLSNANQGQYILPISQGATSQSQPFQKFSNSPEPLQSAPVFQKLPIQNNVAQSLQSISSNYQQFPFPDKLNQNIQPSQNRQIEPGYIYNSPANPHEVNLNPTLNHNDNEYQHQNTFDNTGLSLNTNNDLKSYNNIQANRFSNAVYSNQLPQQHFISQHQNNFQFNQNHTPQVPQAAFISNQAPQTYNNVIRSNIQNGLTNFQPTQPTTISHNRQNQQPINHNDRNIKVNTEYDRSHSTVSKSQVSQNPAIVDYNAPRYNQQLSHTATASGAIQNSYTGVASSHSPTNGQYSNGNNNLDSHAASISTVSVQGSTRNSQGSRETVPSSNSEQFSDHRHLYSYNPVTGYKY